MSAEHGAEVTRRTLADGRELLYFDSPGSALGRNAVDGRDLRPVMLHPTRRFDPLLGEWVVLAPHRQSRTFLPAAEQCPLCPSTPERATEIPEPTYQVVALQNRFPSLATGTLSSSRVPGALPAEGRCEVLCFTDRHETSLAQLDPARVRLVVEAWAHRSTELARRPEVAHVFCFENHGEEIGVTLSHPHGQIYAYPFVPPRVQRILDRAVGHRDRHGGNLFGEVLDAERHGPRVVSSGAHWTAFVPAAARWPHEVSLYCHRQVPDLPALTGAERDDLATVYLDVLRRFARLFPDPMSYVAAWNQAPVRGPGRECWWLHLQLFSVRRAADRLKYLAGSESGMGVFVTDTNPEDVAAALRAVDPS